MLRQTILLLISLAFLAQSAPVSREDQPTPYEDAAAYEVYSAIVPWEWPVPVAQAKMLVIRRETRAYRMCLRPEKESENIMGKPISEYVRLGEKTWLLQPKFDLGIPYKLITLDELNGGKGDFYKQHPDSRGWIELSAVGFNDDKTVAVVYMGHHCGGLCGGGRFHVLQKKNGKWIPLEWRGKKCGWES